MTVADELLRACLDDDVPLFTAARLIHADAPTSDWASRRASMLSMLSDLAQAGLVELGDSAHGRFRPWPQNGPDTAARLADLIRVDEPDGQHAAWAFAAWIRTTERGDDEAFGLIERESCLDDGRALASLRALQAGDGPDRR